MGKLFAVAVIVITLISVSFFVMHTWWMPVDISTTGPAIDRQLEETMTGSGLLFLAGQVVLGLFVWQASDKSPARKIKTFPGGANPLVAAAIILVGIEILTLTFVGSKAWGAVNLAPPAADSLHIDVQAEQFAFYFRYAGPDGQFGGIHPDKIDDGSGNYFGLDPANDVAARDDVVVGSLVIPVNRPILLSLHSRTSATLSTSRSCASNRTLSPASKFPCTSRPRKPANGKSCARSCVDSATTT
jgi:cytochrome c oxidase subunit 2